MIPNPEQDSDPRNLRYEDIALGGEVSESGDVEKGGWNVYQGKTSACTAHSTVHGISSVTGWKLSPRYAFKKIKTDPKYPSSRLNWGAYMIDSLKLMVNEGIAELIYAPNSPVTSDIDYLNLSISQQMEVSADRHKGGSYIYVSSGSDSLDNFDRIRRFMAEQRLPVKVGIDWRGSFNNARTSGVVPTTAASGSLSGHDMLAVAWKHINGHEYLGFHNSFGATWGDQGRIWMPKGFFKISSAIAYLPPKKTEEIGITIPAPVENRNKYLEQAKALELQRATYEKFPLDVELKAKQSNLLARGIAGRNWLVLVNAITYKGWTVTDVVNHLYAKSRGKTETKAFSFDFNQSK